MLVRVLKSSASLKAWEAMAHEKGWRILTVVGWPYVEIYCVP